MKGDGWGPEMTVITSEVTQKSSLQRFASFLPEDGERNIFFFFLLLLVFAPHPPDTDCGKSVFFTVYDTCNGGGQARGCRASGGFGVKKDWD